MPKTSFAAASRGLPTFTRRTALTGLAATALTSVTVSAADHSSPVVELIEDYRFACAEREVADERAAEILFEMQTPVAKVHIGNLLVDGKKEPIFAFTHNEVDRRADQIDIPEVPQWHTRATRLRELWHRTLSEAQERYDREADRRGMPEADDVADKAWNAEFCARDAVLTYPCQTVADYRARDSFIRELIINDRITDDVVDLVFSGPLSQQSNS